MGPTLGSPSGEPWAIADGDSEARRQQLAWALIADAEEVSASIVLGNQTLPSAWTPTVTTPQLTTRSVALLGTPTKCNTDALRRDGVAMLGGKHRCIAR